MASEVTLTRGTGKDAETYKTDSPAEVTQLVAGGWSVKLEDAAALQAQAEADSPAAPKPATATKK